MKIRRLSLVFMTWSMSLIALPQGRGDTKPVRDPKALSILQQVVQAAGGIQGIDAVPGYSASGRIVLYRTDERSEGDVLMKIRGTQDFRLGIHLADGSSEWWAVQSAAGFKGEADGTTRPLQYQELINIRSWCSPLAQLVRAIRDPGISVALIEQETKDGRIYFGVRIALVPPAEDPQGVGKNVLGKDIYVDSESFQIAGIGDFSYGMDDLTTRIRRRVIFSDYRDVGGVLFPFSIYERIGDNAPLLEMHFTDVTVTAFTDQDFAPGP